MEIGYRHRILPGLTHGISFGAGLCLVCVIGFVGALVADELFQFSPGDIVSSTQLNRNFSRLERRLAPIGSIVAWHRDFSGTPGIPEGWVECNGQTVSDSDSPFYNTALPNLNATGRFLRGGSVSGTAQDDALQAHAHSISSNTHNHAVERIAATTLIPGGDGITETAGATGWIGGKLQTLNDTHNHTIGSPTDSGSGAGSPRTANETRPSNISVIWIMRIK